MSSQRKKLQVVSQTTTVKAVEPAKKKKNRRRKRKSPSQGSGSSASCAREYVNLVYDPFENLPCPIGLGTFAPTKVCSIQNHYTLLTYGDGQGMLMLKPNLSNPAAWFGSAAAWENLGSGVTTGTFESARFLAAGVRITADAGGNDKASRFTWNQLNYNLIGDKDSNVSAHLSGIDGVAAGTWSNTQGGKRVLAPAGNTVEFVLLPVDLATFSFGRWRVEDSGGEYSYIAPICGPTGFLSIQGTGSMKYFVDIICHYEYFPTASAGEAIPRGPTTTTTMEEIYRFLKQHVSWKDIGHFVQYSEKFWDLQHGALKYKTSSESKHDLTLKSIDDYISQLDVSSLADSDKQHLLHIASLVESAASSPFMSTRTPLSLAKQAGSRGGK